VVGSVQGKSGPDLGIFARVLPVYLAQSCQNPVRARMVSEPKRYPWSRCRSRLGDQVCEWLYYDACYLALGCEDEERKARYRAFLHSAIPAGEWALIWEAAQREHLTGSGRFTEEVAEIVGKRIERSGQGRPEKSGIWSEK